MSHMLLTKMNLYARESFDSVCDRKGLQIATYLLKQKKNRRREWENEEKGLYANLSNGISV